MTSLIAFLAVAAPAEAAPKSCQREGAKLLAAGGSVRVVSVKEKPQNSETRRDRIYGCWTTTGRRFTLFLQRDFGLDLIERAHFEIVDGRYIGVIRQFEGGVSESLHRRHLGRPEATAPSTTPSRATRSPAGDFAASMDAVFFRGGGMAYTCWRQSRIVDGKGDRELEPAGTRVTQLGDLRATRTASASASTTPSTTRP